MAAFGAECASPSQQPRGTHHALDRQPAHILTELSPFPSEFRGSPSFEFQFAIILMDLVCLLAYDLRRRVE